MIYILIQLPQCLAPHQWRRVVQNIHTHTHIYIHNGTARGKMALIVCYWNSIWAGGENGSRVQIAYKQTQGTTLNIYFPLRLISRASKQCTAQISAINHTTRDRQRRKRERENTTRARGTFKNVSPLFSYQLLFSALSPPQTASINQRIQHFST